MKQAITIPEGIEGQLIQHEGIRLKPYRCTAGKLTIGVGRNLDDVGISHGEAVAMLRRDIQRCVQEVAAWAPWAHLTTARRRVMVDMCFNMGINRLRRFRKMLAALKRKKYEAAAYEMLDSKWANQVGQRAQTLAEMMRRG